MVSNIVFFFYKYLKIFLRLTFKVADPSRFISAYHIHLLKNVHVPYDLITFFFFLTYQQINFPLIYEYEASFYS